MVFINNMQEFDMNLEFNYTFPKADNEVALTMEIGSVEWDNNGIGSFEYGSIRGYDKGTDYVVGFNEWDVWAVKTDGTKVNLRESAKDYVCDYVLENESLMEKINESFAEEGDCDSDYEDDRYDAMRDESDEDYWGERRYANA